MLSDRLLFLAGETYISSHAVVGAPGEDKRNGVCPPNHGVEVGHGVVIREFATVHGGFIGPTRIGERCYIMAHCHLGHDCELGPDVTLATGATLGGHTRVHEGANVGLRAVTHQHVTIGAYAMIGAGAVVLEDVPPFETWAGVPAKFVTRNMVGMQRAGFTQDEIDFITGVGVAGGPGDTARVRDLYARFDQDKGRRGR